MRLCSRISTRGLGTLHTRFGLVPLAPFFAVPSSSAVPEYCRASSLSRSQLRLSVLASLLCLLPPKRAVHRSHEARQRIFPPDGSNRRLTPESPGPFRSVLCSGVIVALDVHQTPEYAVSREIPTRCTARKSSKLCSATIQRETGVTRAAHDSRPACDVKMLIRNRCYQLCNSDLEGTVTTLCCCLV